MPILRLALVLVICLAGGCGDGRARACFGSTTFCEDAFGRNQAPQARAAAESRVVAGENVELDGTDSFDTDGTITGYSWVQEEGPAVALTDASQALAAFVAPDVPVETVLDFRLLVTDDDQASDTDRVQITVVPAAAAALHRGLTLLKTVHHPEAHGAAPGDTDTLTYLGLWLAARVSAAAAGAEPEMDRLLDEVRFLELVRARVDADELSEHQRRIFALGQREVARFTRRRDPATAERALDLSAGAPPPSVDAWRQALAAARPDLAWSGDPAADRRRAVRRLLRQAADPGAIAADVLILALTGGMQPRTLGDESREHHGKEAT